MIQTVQDLLDSQQITPLGWDLLVIGDGAGIGFDRPAGWAAILIDRISGGRTILQGGVSNDTINWAEIQPAYHALRYDYYKYTNKKPRVLTGEDRRIHIFSDCQNVVSIGNNWAVAHQNQDVWAGINFFRTTGYQITFHFIERNSIALHRLADQLTQVGLLMAVTPEEDLYRLLPMNETPAEASATPV